jgi:hypothetical protein
LLQKLIALLFFKLFCCIVTVNVGFHHSEYSLQENMSLLAAQSPLEVGKTVTKSKFTSGQLAASDSMLEEIN